ncbi:NADP-dependent isopropanol dehydrogenase [Desulfosarcina cetonica]|nr:NADP-dependent isopropanol dehydrogenase [Desulfosarcina cetonica]
MKAFVMHAVGETGFMRKPIPRPGANDAVVKTGVALVCTSDCHVVNGSVGKSLDLTLGHEATGVVHRLGEAVRSVRVGDRVAVNSITPCYTCHHCQRGCSSQCGGLLGGWKFSHQRDGVFADFFLVNHADANLVVIPDEISDEAACYTSDMMSTGFAGAEAARIPLGGTVAIYGQGPVGLMATAGARLQGAGQIITVDKRANRLALSRFYGADTTIDFTEVDPDEAIMDLTRGVGVDAAIEAIGSQMALDACLRVIRPGGVIVNIGIHSDGDAISILVCGRQTRASEVTIRSILCPGGKERMSRLMRLIANRRVDPTRMTTHVFPFNQLDRAFALMSTKEEGVIKPLIRFG